MVYTLWVLRNVVAGNFSCMKRIKKKLDEKEKV